MTADESDRGPVVDQFANEMIDALDRSGRFEALVAERVDDSMDEEVLDEACVRVADELLKVTPPRTAQWEHFLVTLASHSSKSRQRHGLHVCELVIHRLRAMLAADELTTTEPAKLITLASALTVVLAAQEKLRQDVEQTMLALCEAQPDLLGEIAEHCQSIWKRHGQMAGGNGLFFWDTRSQEWRLAQDFKIYRPEST